MKSSTVFDGQLSHKHEVAQQLSQNADESWALALLNECELMDREAILKPLSKAPSQALLERLDQETAFFDECVSVDDDADSVRALSDHVQDENSLAPVSITAPMTAIERQVADFKSNVRASVPESQEPPRRSILARIKGAFA